MREKEMNERIEQLLEQARAECFQFGSKPATTVGYDELEKFAKLIVRECLEQSSILANHYIDTHSEQEQVMLLASIADCSSQIKKHFGVE
jgi:hypothetical protein